MLLGWFVLIVGCLFFGASSSCEMKNVIQLATKDEIKQYLATTIASISQQMIAEKDLFTIALSGGSLPEMLEGSPPPPPLPSPLSYSFLTSLYLYPSLFFPLL
jgi:hypothetical protein